MGKPSLADAYPEIAAQWHPTRNGDLTPRDVTIGSGRKIWWVCPKVPEHVWDARVNARVKGRGCRYCGGKVKFGKEYKSFAEAHPEVVVEWHPTKNGDLTPDKVPEGSGIVVWWKCSRNPEHEWEAKVQYRKSLLGGGSCPICGGRTISYETSFAGKHSALAEQWHPTKNGELKPTDFFPNSRERVWWVCRKDPSHEWQAQIKTRIETSGECPFCKRQNSKQMPMLSEYDGELAKEWHPTRNGSLTPDQVRAGAEIKVWWLCKNDKSHEWDATVSNRARKGRGCPFCAGMKASKDRNIAVLYPQLAAEWHSTKNKLSPYEVTPGSKRKVWWRCLVNPEHAWEAYVFSRTKGEGNCPHCAQSGKSFAEKYPEVAQEWHPSRNGKVAPDDIPHSSAKKYWWLCSVNPNHEWQATAQNRGLNGSGCPYCYAERQLRGYLVESAISNADYYQTYLDGIKNVQRLLKLEPPMEEQKVILSRLLYANVVSLMETFLSDAITNLVQNDPLLKRRLVEKVPRFSEAKITKSETFAWFERMDKEVADYLQSDVTYHNIFTVEKLYKSVLDVKFPSPDDLADLRRIIETRHDIVHRNGKTVEGKAIVLSTGDVKFAIKTVNEFVSHVEKQLPRNTQ